MNEKEKIKELIHKIGSKYMQGYGSELKWYKREIKLLQQHDQLILEEFVEYMTCGNEDHIGMEYTVKEFKDNLEQFRKERNK